MDGQMFDLGPRDDRRARCGSSRDVGEIHPRRLDFIGDFTVILGIPELLKWDEK